LASAFARRAEGAKARRQAAKRRNAQQQANARHDQPQDCSTGPWRGVMLGLMSNKAATAVVVETAEGYQGEQEPCAIVKEGERLCVLGINDRWQDPDARYFKAAVDDGCVYLLRHDLRHDTWSIVQTWVLDA
jgi:hypothetical protein